MELVSAYIGESLESLFGNRGIPLGSKIHVVTNELGRQHDYQGIYLGNTSYVNGSRAVYLDSTEPGREGLAALISISVITSVKVVK